MSIHKHGAHKKLSAMVATSGAGTADPSGAHERVNQNSYIEEEQTTQRPKENVQKDKQRSTKHTHKN
jgi:hypothetical protein